MQKTQIKYMVALALAMNMVFWFVMILLFAGQAVNAAEPERSHLCSLDVIECTGQPIEQMIRRKAREAGVNEHTAVRIAKCESGLDPRAKNKRSSATGLYQFTIGTWRHIGAEKAGLDRTNPEHSLAMFLKFYKKNKGWWACK